MAYFKKYTDINAQTGTSYTLVLGDLGQLITLTNESAITLEVPLNSSVAFPIGTQIDLVQGDEGTVTVQSTAGATINSNGSLTDLNGQWASASLIKTGSDTWLLIGNLA